MYVCIYTHTHIYTYTYTHRRVTELLNDAVNDALANSPTDPIAHIAAFLASKAGK